MIANLRRATVAGLLVLTLTPTGAMAVNTPASAGPKSAQLLGAFAAAAREFAVPEELLLAVSYHLTRWDDHGAEPSAAGGYGPMHLTDVTVEDLRAESDRDVPVSATAVAADESLHRLDAAARLLGVPKQRLVTDPATNIRGGAALLARAVRTRPGTLAGWYPAVAWYSGARQADGGRAFADDVFESLRSGVTRTTNRGQRVTLPRTAAATPPARPLTATAQDPPTECPADIACRFIPTAYAWTDRTDPNGYGNYDPTDRPADGNRIRYIVVHDTESSYDATIAGAQNPLRQVSFHYVIRSRDGDVTQMLRTRDFGWHAANTNINAESIGIEHEGVAREGASWYTEAMYRSSAKLVRYLADRYGIPLDRTHIIGHDEIERERPDRVAAAHWDPGPYWDWARYMELIGAPDGTSPGAVRAGDVVTVDPDFAANRQAIPSCSPQPCRDLPEQGTNFVFLRTEPRDDAPLINDPALQPDGSPGRRHAEDWSNKAVTGRQYVVAEVRGDWVAIWFAGKRAWLNNARGDSVKRSEGRKVTPVAGRDSIPVYGLAVPEASEYPQGVPVRSAPPLQYTIPAGQQYVAGEVRPAAYYYARFNESNVPHNHTMIRGAQVYLRISLNHRWGFVKLSDVTEGSDGSDGSGAP